jgi:hypothetical protein
MFAGKVRRLDLLWNTLIGIGSALTWSQTLEDVLIFFISKASVMKEKILVLMPVVDIAKHFVFVTDQESK